MQPGFDQKAWQRQQPGRHPGCQPHDMAVFNENVQNWAFSASIQIRNAADHAQELEKRKTAHKGGPRWQMPVPYPSWNPSPVFGTHQWRWNAPWRFLKPQHFSMLLGSFSFAKSMLSILSNSMLRACYPDATHVLHKCLHVAKMVLKWCFRQTFQKSFERWHECACNCDECHKMPRVLHEKCLRVDMSLIPRRSFSQERKLPSCADVLNASLVHAKEVLHTCLSNAIHVL